MELKGRPCLYNLTAFLSYVLIVSFTPGPNVVLSMVNANKFGYRKTFKFLLGIFLGFFIIMFISNYFNLLLFNIIPKIKSFMGIIGAVYMTFLAILILKSKGSSEEKVDDRLNSFFTGFSLQFINPKLILYAITVSSNFIVPYYKSNIVLLLFTIFLSSLIFISVSLWALFGALFKQFLSKYRKPFNLVMGLLLLYGAISISGILEFLN